MSLEEKLNVNEKGLLSRVSNKIKKSITTKVLAYGLAASLALGSTYGLYSCGGSSGGGGSDGRGNVCTATIEICDYVDNDCDGLIDEDLRGCYQCNDTTNYPLYCQENYMCCPDANPYYSPGDDLCYSGSVLGAERCKYEGPFIFLTRTFGASISTWNGNLGGLAGADAKCKERLEISLLAGLADPYLSGRKWVAWLSDSNTDAIDRINDLGRAYYKVDRIGRVFNNKFHMTMNPLGPLYMNQEGVDGIYDTVWTGTVVGGLRSTYTCLDWTSSSSAESGVVGRSGEIDYKWVNDYSSPCNFDRSLYCIEQ